MIAFGTWLISFNWQILINIPDVNLKIAYFFTIMWAMIERFFQQIPMIAVRIAVGYMKAKMTFF